MQAIILSIGDELVLGQNIDTNSAYLSQYLASRGLSTLYHQTVADDQSAIAWAIDQASTRADLILITGGLGPTADDLTRQALAQAMNVELVEDPASIKAIEDRYKQLGRMMPERNRVQALHPQGSQIIPNHWGTAPGIYAKLNRSAIYVMPGVPQEMKAIFEAFIAPQIDQLTGDRQVILTHKINTYGMGESLVAEKLGRLMDRSRNPKVGTTVADAIVSVRVRSEFDTQQEAQTQLDDTIAQIKTALGPAIFGENGQTLWQSVVNLLKKQNATLATAESCTAGLIAKLITDVPGSSDVFLGGWVTYTNGMKTSQLQVHEETIARHGAVSEPVAIQMALGALKASDAKYALSVTGIAGPGGGTHEQPVGTVWIGLAYHDGQASPHTTPQAFARCFQISGQRDDVRDRSAKSALQLLRYFLMGENLGNLLWLKLQPKASDI